MAGSFILLETGRRSLSAHQRALDTVGHNMANASTAGFSRQEVVKTQTSALHLADGLAVGTGVKLTDIRRHRDAFLDAQFRDHSGQLAGNRHLLDTLEQVEMLIGEPSDVGVMSCLEMFWMSLNELSQHPDSMAARALARQNGVTLATVINGLAGDLENLRRDIDETIVTYANETNALMRDLHHLNQEIASAQVANKGTADLQDRRDLFLDRMAELTGSWPTALEEGQIRVMLDGIPLVEARAYHELEVVRSADGSLSLYRSDLEMPVEAGGALGALIDRSLPLVDQVQHSVFQLIDAIVTEFNHIHEQGYGLDGSTGVPFFVMEGDAATFALSEELLDGDAGLRAIAAGLTEAPGDGDNARRLAALKEELEIGGFHGWDDYWRQVVAELGVHGAEANWAVDVGRLMVKDIENRRDMVKGVSLDEEVTNMIRFQHAYAAAARLVTAADEMLDIIINRMAR